ncbi:MAG: PASTA domain-containing protein, partial [Prolixibacteraceae bacterium]|nr:PASTA domain-containing protein [Prolixibacteraceae bacterium]
LQGTEYILGEVTQIDDNERIGFIVRQSISRVENNSGRFPIHITYAVETPNRIQPVRYPQRPVIEIPPEIIERQKVLVPQLVGERFDDFRIAEILAENNLRLGDTVSVVDDQNAGFIVRQYPIAETEVNTGTQVIIAFGVERQINTATSIPQETENVIVPNYIGLTIDRAIGRMPNDRLSPVEPRIVNSDAPPNIVIAQFPEPEMEVDPGTEIFLEISGGQPEESPPIQVPRLIGRSLREAAEILRESDLFVGNISEQISEEPEGIIIRQLPGAGTEVQRGEAVDIVYSINVNNEVQVPNVVNLPRIEAILVIKESGLNYSVKNGNQDDIPVDNVIDQFPEPGTMVPTGSKVTIITQRDNNNIPPPWFYWGGGILAAGLMGGFIGRKINTGRGKKPIGKKDVSVNLKPVWDVGKQTISYEEKNVILNKIHLKSIPDKGIQTLKTN